MINKKLTATAVALVAALAATAAQAEGHYVTGVEGLQGSSVPPAGNYYLGYLVHYDINGFQAPDSKNSIGGSGKVTALANRFVKITDTKLFGADYGFETIIPVLRTSVKVGTLDASDSGVGDVYVGPLVLGWHGPQWDAVAAAGLWLDNGSTSDPASPGKGYKSTMLTGGLTYHFDAAKTLSASALARYEFNGKNDAGFRHGDQMTVEWGLSKGLGPVSLGLVGYSQWQTSGDSGPGAGNDKAARHAVGAEVVYPILSAGVFLKGAYYKEVNVKAGSGGAEPKGSMVRFTLVKAF